MDKSSAIMDLVSGYETYSDVEELNTTAAADAPASTPACGAATVSFIASQFSVKTYNDGC